MIKRNLKIKNGFISRSGSIDFYATGGLFYNNGEVLTINSTASFTLTSSFNNFTSSYNTGSFSGSLTGNISGTSSWTINSNITLPSSSATTALSGFGYIIYKSGSILNANTSYYSPVVPGYTSSFLELIETTASRSTTYFTSSIYYMTVTTTSSIPVGATLNVYLTKNGISSGLSCSVPGGSPAGVYTGSNVVNYTYLDSYSYNLSYTASSGDYRGLNFITLFGTVRI